MKYTTASVIALAGVADALPHSQFSLPSFSMPSFSLPTGLGGGSSTGGSGLGGLLGGLGGGSGFSFPSIPAATGGAGLGLPGLGGSGFSIPSIPAATGGAGLGLPGLGGSGFSIPSIPSATDGAGVSLPGLGGSGLGDLSNVQVTSTATASGAAPTTTGSTGGSAEGVQNNGASCQTSTGGSTEDGVKNGNCCTDMTVIFARGTGEMGNMGTVSGPPMVKAIRSKLGADKVTVQGVDYAASAAVSASYALKGANTNIKSGQRQFGCGWWKSDGSICPAGAQAVPWYQDHRLWIQPGWHGRSQCFQQRRLCFQRRRCCSVRRPIEESGASWYGHRQGQAVLRYFRHNLWWRR